MAWKCAVTRAPPGGAIADGAWGAVSQSAGTPLDGLPAPMLPAGARDLQAADSPSERQRSGRMREDAHFLAAMRRRFPVPPLSNTCPQSAMG